MNDLSISKEISELLSLKQLRTLMYIVNQIIDNSQLIKSNNEIADELSMPVSTLEKHLKKFDDLGLIIRTSKRERDPLLNRWETTSREIKLNPQQYDMKALAALKEQRLNAMFDLIKSSSFTTDAIKRMKVSRSQH